jgi:hypothetical protein
MLVALSDELQSNSLLLHAYSDYAESRWAAVPGSALRDRPINHSTAEANPTREL